MIRSTKKLFTDPQICPSSHDIKKEWYVWFRFYDAHQDTWIQKRYKAGINEFKSLKERLPEANALKRVLKKELDKRIGEKMGIPRQKDSFAGK
jgi:hypothetical protein